MTWSRLTSSGRHLNATLWQRLFPSRGPFVTTRLAAITVGRDHNATPATGRISVGKDIRLRYSLWGDLAYFKVR